MTTKTICGISVLLLTLPHVWGADSISIEELEKISDPSDRAKMIDQAPLEQRDELKRLDFLHQELLRRWGGEAGLKTARETQVARARGLVCLESLFVSQLQVWDNYIGGVLEANKKAGMTHEKQIEAEKGLLEEQGLISKRLPIVHSLVFNMAASPEALELNKRAGEWGNKLSNRLMTPNSPFFTKEERIEVDRQMDQIFEEMQKLPKLPPEQVQKEFDAFTDDKVRPW